jgi:hypothetical protein
MFDPGLVVLALVSPAPMACQQEQEVPVTIKELDLAEAMREFQAFQRRLGEFREEIGEGRRIARETAQILEDLRKSASPSNQYNEEPILGAVGAYVDGVIQKQVELVDFLESQRYRITYYANKMASSVRPEDLALLFGTPEQNEEAIATRAVELERSRAAIADFIDALPSDQFDRATFQPTRRMPSDAKQKLDALLYGYQQEKNAIDFAKKRLQLVRSAGRAVPGNGAVPEVDADLLVGQMFGALDRIRLQMSLDLLYLEQLLQGYSQSTRTQEILAAFQSLIELQGDLEGPSPELASVLDWLQDSSARRISLSARGLTRPGLDIPRASDLLREAYEGARKPQE